MPGKPQCLGSVGDDLLRVAALGPDCGKVDEYDAASSEGLALGKGPLPQSTCQRGLGLAQLTKLHVPGPSLLCQA